MLKLVTEHTFTLRYRLPQGMTCAEAVELLGRAGCEHMLFGVGVPGRIAACVSVDTPSPEKVERFARLQIENSVPGIQFINDVSGWAECTMSYVHTTYVKCPNCGWLHFVVSAERAMRQVQQTNSAFQLQGIQQRAFFNSYLHCFRCGQDSAAFQPAQESDAPLGVTIQPVVIER